MEEWKEYKLGDVLSIKYGKDHKHLADGNIPIYGSGGIMRYGEISLYSGPSILIPRKGSLNNIMYSDKPFWTVDTMFWTIINEEIANPLFVYYSICKKNFASLNVGSAVPSLTVPIIEDIDILLPSKQVQDKVVTVLKSLDDKIEVNRRINDNFVIEKFFEILLIWMLTTPINDNLEQQAQALFKSWFVDFEPFCDGEFVDSELGMIPKGWRVGRYDDIIESSISGDWGKEHPEGNYTHKVACIRGCDFQDIKNGLRGETPERFILEKNFQTKHFRDKDVLVEISGGTATVSTGRVCPVSQLLIDKFNEDIVCTNFCRLVRPMTNYGSYLYYSWLYKYNNKIMFGYENGTSGIKNFRIKDFTALEPVVIPSEDALLSFQVIIDKLQMKLQMNGSESQKLATLRDTLLPKLMSGELKVFDKPND